MKPSVERTATLRSTARQQWRLQHTHDLPIHERYRLFDQLRKRRCKRRGIVHCVLHARRNYTFAIEQLGDFAYAVDLLRCIEAAAKEQQR